VKRREGRVCERTNVGTGGEVGAEEWWGWYWGSGVKGLESGGGGSMNSDMLGDSHLHYRVIVESFEGWRVKVGVFDLLGVILVWS